MDVWFSYVDQILIFVALAVSLNLLQGHAGVLSAAQAGFAAIGGYGVAYLTTAHGLGFPLSLAIGVALAAAFGGLLALPSLRLEPEYLILLTVVASSVIVGVIAALPQLGGTYGIQDLPTVDVLGVHIETPGDWVVPLAVGALLTFLVCLRLGESPFGRILRALRVEPRVASSLGKDVFRAQLFVFATTSGMAGFAGGLYVAYLGIANPGAFAFAVSLSIFAMVILGGNGNLYGSVVGAVVVTGLQPALEQGLHLDPERATTIRLLVYGSLIVLMIRFRPEGLLPERLVLGLRARPAGDGTALPDRVAALVVTEHEALASESGHPGVDVAAKERAWHEQEIVLSVRGLAKRFGGVVAADGLDLDLRRGTITALVGPNGAGKTTVFNLVCGFLAPDAGQVHLDGADITGLRPHLIARAGMVRSFQDVRVIDQLSCLDNVALGIQGQPGERVSALLTRPIAASEAATRERALHWLEYVGMADHAHVAAGTLSFGQAKLVALARVLATDARVILLDEPASGVDTQWVEVMLALVEAIRADQRTICIVEHNLHVVSRLADHVYFMEAGAITAQGSVDDLVRDPRLGEVYFGRA